MDETQTPVIDKSLLHLRMWPRKILYWRKNKKLPSDLQILEQPGVYVLYRDDIPYYIGKADRLIRRLNSHARPDARYGLFWNYFTVFVVADKEQRTLIETILITAFPTANGAKPQFKKRTRFSKEFRAFLREKLADGLESDSSLDDAQDEDE